MTDETSIRKRWGTRSAELTRDETGRLAESWRYDLQAAGELLEELAADVARLTVERDEARLVVCERAAYGRPGHESDGDYDKPENAADDFGWDYLYPRV